MPVTGLWPALPWLAPFFTLPRFARLTPNLADARHASGRLVSVVIPARNESATIELVVRSVLASAYTPLEVVVVDDRSTDDTAAIVSRIAAEDARLRLVRGAPLPPGWFGKPWACEQGYRAARGELLLFTDADTRHAPELLGRAVAALEDLRADVLSVIGAQRCVTFWERVVMPQVWLLLGLRYPVETVNRARRPSAVVANGQFILATRAAYEGVGTHAAVRHEVVEDVALAQATVRAGRKLVLVHGATLLETRMYHGLAHLIEGWSKNLYLGARRSLPDEPVRRALVPLLLLGPFLFWLAPLVLLVLPGFHAAGLIATLLAATFWGLVSWGMGIPARYGLAFPLGAAMAAYITLRSVARGTRGVEWKGRVYRVAEGSDAVAREASR
jgi:chlorobactene glucosyltransferase